MPTQPGITLERFFTRGSVRPLGLAFCAILVGACSNDPPASGAGAHGASPGAAGGAAGELGGAEEHAAGGGLSGGLGGATQHDAAGGDSGEPSGADRLSDEAAALTGWKGAGEAPGQRGAEAGQASGAGRTNDNTAATDQEDGGAANGVGDESPGGFSEVVWEGPLDGAAGSNPTVLVWGRAPNGAKVWLDSKRATAVRDGVFSLELAPRPGDNRLLLHVAIAGEERVFRRRFIHVPRRRLEEMLGKLNKQRNVLTEINRLEEQLARSVDGYDQLVLQIHGDSRQKADTLLAEIRADLAELQRVRAEIDQDLTSTLTDISQMRDTH